MDLEQTYIQELDKLIEEGGRYLNPDSNQNGYSYSSITQANHVYGWLAGACLLIQSLVTNENHVYVIELKKLLNSALVPSSDRANEKAGSALALLSRIRSNINAGILVNLRDKVRAEAFDDFLLHADEYLKENKQMESGVIAGVVFEDTIRKICSKLGIETDGKQLDHLINALKSQGYIKKTKASRCKVASTVRGTAAHANWDELDIGSVRDTIVLTRELICEFLER